MFGGSLEAFLPTGSAAPDPHGQRPIRAPPAFLRVQQQVKNFNPRMAMSWTRGLKHGVVPRHAAQLVESRSLAIASKAKKGGKADAGKTPALSQELKSTTVFGANIFKEGSDPKIQPDSEYPDWLWHLLDKRPVLSELRRKDPKTLSYEDLKRFVKLDNRSRIKIRNDLNAKN